MTKPFNDPDEWELRVAEVWRRADTLSEPDLVSTVDALAAELPP